MNSEQNIKWPQINDLYNTELKKSTAAHHIDIDNVYVNNNNNEISPSKFISRSF